ncbi:hypothetical protein LSH36_1157g00060 [Paralvinella palmiformis]|uniref:BTB domain-containing protein n=1 Tax=Paralvinella palmiformis TaxID=53620 RepID=A0AAD9IVJ4_9ANNE|nr:hypothetical protein LSH36_1157g00060 [Paralvinella palmiformis]
MFSSVPCPKTVGSTRITRYKKARHLYIHSRVCYFTNVNRSSFLSRSSTKSRSRTEVGGGVRRDEKMAKMVSSKKLMSDPNRAENVLRGFDVMRAENTCTDFTLVAQGRSFRVHKQLLAVSSEYFQGCFRSGMLETQTDTMHLREISASGLQQVLDFLYKGRMTLSKKIVSDVLDAAVFLHINEAVNLCCAYLLGHLKIKSIHDYLQLADAYDLKEFRKAVDEFILENFHKVAKGEELLHFEASTLERYLTDDRLRNSEYKLYRAVERWLLYDPATREQFANVLLSHIRYGHMSNEELNRLRKRSLFNENPLFCEYVDEGMSFRCSTLQKQITCFKSERTQVRNRGHIIALANMDTKMQSCILMNERWYVLKDGLDQPRPFINASVCVVNNFLFVCGGDSNIPEEQSNMCFCFKPYNCTWNRLSNMRQGRRNFALVGHGDFLYAIGGIGKRDRLLDTVEKYDIQRDSWSYTCAMGKGLSDMAHCSHRGEIYVAGGVDENCINMTTFKTFNPKISMWKRRADILNIKFRPRLFAARDHLYLADLYRTEGLPSRVEMYHIPTNQWSVVDGFQYLFSRYFSAVMLGGWLYFIGRNEVEDGHSKRYNLHTKVSEDIADFPWPVDGPLCCVLKIPPKVLKSKVIRHT